MTNPPSKIARAARRSAAALLVGIAGLLAWERITFDRAAWLADYAQLREHTTAVYANLQWSLRERGVDPAQLHAQTLEQLHAAGTDRAARAAIAGFIEAFADGHFRVSRVKLSKRLAAWWGGLWRGDPAPLTGASSGADACSALGFTGAPGELRAGLATLPGFVALGTEDNAFPAGTFALDDGRRVGIVRIAAFDQHRHEAACVRAWERVRGEIAGRCDDECVDRFVHTTAPNQLLHELAARAEALAAAKVDLLVVDVTRNGGGTDWADPAARIFTTRELACPRLAFIKHPHWADRMAGILGEIDADLAGERTPPDREILTNARSRVESLLTRAREPCDLSGIWDGAAPTCAKLVEDEYFACGVFGHLPPGSLTGASSRGALFKALDYSYRPGVYAGPLVVLTDGGTASAAEHFVAMLADSGAAVIVGERTHGSGCGYTNGGVPAILEHSGLRVELPDCQRRRADGTNELAGITPVIAVDGSDEATLRQKWLAALAQVGRG